MQFRLLSCPPPKSHFQTGGERIGPTLANFRAVQPLQIVSSWRLNPFFSQCSRLLNQYRCGQKLLLLYQSPVERDEERDLTFSFMPRRATKIEYRNSWSCYEHPTVTGRNVQVKLQRDKKVGRRMVWTGILTLLTHMLRRLHYLKLPNIFGSFSILLLRSITSIRHTQKIWLTLTNVFTTRKWYR